jgi:hypothetical protein
VKAIKEILTFVALLAFFIILLVVIGMTMGGEPR